MENLLQVLSQECDAYEGLLELSGRKTAVIVSNDLEALTKITEEEQDQASLVTNLEKRRVEVMKDMANVLNKDVNTLTLARLAELMKDRPQDAQALLERRDRLTRIVADLKRVNGQNAELLKNAMEMVDFELNLLQSMKKAPETANYTRGAYNTGDVMGVSRQKFDAKQ